MHRLLNELKEKEQKSLTSYKVTVTNECYVNVLWTNLNSSDGKLVEKQVLTAFTSVVFCFKSLYNVFLATQITSGVKINLQPQTVGLWLYTVTEQTTADVQPWAFEKETTGMKDTY